MPERPVEYLHWRATGTGLIEVAAEPGFDGFARVDATAVRTGSRNAYFEELGGFADTPSYAAERLVRGGTLEGPALIDSATTTIVVVPGQRVTADGRGSVLMEAA